MENPIYSSPSVSPTKTSNFSLRDGSQNTLAQRGGGNWVQIMGANNQGEGGLSRILCMSSSTLLKGWMGCKRNSLGGIAGAIHMKTEVKLSCIEIVFEIFTTLN